MRVSSTSSTYSGPERRTRIVDMDRVLAMAVRGLGRNAPKIPFRQGITLDRIAESVGITSEQLIQIGVYETGINVGKLIDSNFPALSIRFEGRGDDREAVTLAERMTLAGKDQKLELLRALVGRFGREEYGYLIPREGGIKW